MRRKGEWTQESVRTLCDNISEGIAEWQGIPVPLGEDQPLVLCKGHPLQKLYEDLNQSGGVEFEIVSDDSKPITDDEHCRNGWYSRQRQANVYVFQRGEGKCFAVVVRVSPDRSMDRLKLWLQTIGASDAWDLDAEYRARDTLRAMLSDRQWRHYDLTGCFLETSPRSRLTYVFRRLRPTIAMSPRHADGSEDTMRCLATLCAHPVAYYARTWGGAMCPSDDVIAHLTMCRADEAYFWRVCNQHPLSSPEAGL